jgi:hypothetical protein
VPRQREFDGNSKAPRTPSYPQTAPPKLGSDAGSRVNSIRSRMPATSRGARAKRAVRRAATSALATTEYGSSGNSGCVSTRGNWVSSSCVFYDVQQGDMDINCTGSHSCYLPSGRYGVLSTSTSTYRPAYGTATGWDFATGIGTVNVANLVNAWP